MTVIPTTMSGLDRLGVIIVGTVGGSRPQHVLVKRLGHPG